MNTANFIKFMGLFLFVTTVVALRVYFTSDDNVEISAKANQTDNYIVKVINNNLSGLLENKGEVYYDTSIKYNVSPLLLVAITLHETDNCKSNLLKTTNNVAGINHVSGDNYKAIGRYNIYETVENSIDHLGYILKVFYIDAGKKTIDQIGKKYAPLNDYQNGKYGMSNSSWIPNVTKNYNRMEKELEVSKDK